MNFLNYFGPANINEKGFLEFFQEVFDRNNYWENVTLKENRDVHNDDKENVKKGEQGKIFLVDITNIIFRKYYALYKMACSPFEMVSRYPDNPYNNEEKKVWLKFDEQQAIKAIDFEKLVNLDMNLSLIAIRNYKLNIDKLKLKLTNELNLKKYKDVIAYLNSENARKALRKNKYVYTDYKKYVCDTTLAFASAKGDNAEEIQKRSFVSQTTFDNGLALNLYIYKTYGLKHLKSDFVNSLFLYGLSRYCKNNPKLFSEFLDAELENSRDEKGRLIHHIIFDVFRKNWGQINSRENFLNLCKKHSFDSNFKIRDVFDYNNSTWFKEHNEGIFSPLFLPPTNVTSIHLPYILSNLIKHNLKIVINRVDNTIRELVSEKKVGEKWIMETKLGERLKSIIPEGERLIREYPVIINENSHRFDYFLPEKKIAIEYNGIQHYEEVKFFGGTEALKKRVRRDNEKRVYCESNGIKLFICKYDQDLTEFIRKIENYLIA